MGRGVILNKSFERRSFSKQLPLCRSHVLKHASQNQQAPHHARKSMRQTDLHFAKAEIWVHNPVARKKIWNRLRFFFQNSYAMSGAGVLRWHGDESFGRLRQRVGSSAGAAHARAYRYVNFFGLRDDGERVVEGTCGRRRALDVFSHRAEGMTKMTKKGGNVPKCEAFNLT